MRTIKIILGEKEKVYTGPSTWSEVPAEMALKLFNLVKGSSTKKHMLLVVPMLLYKIPYSVLKIFFEARIAARKYQAGADNENYESLSLMGLEILDSCKWVYSENPPSNWLLKHFNVNGQYLDVCSDRLTDLTFGEFIFTETFIATDHAKLCAVLYRKRSWWPRGGRRGEFILEDIDKYAAKLTDEKFNDVKSFVAWNYSGMMQHLKASFPQVFTETSGTTSAAAPVRVSAWMDTALAFCDNDSLKFHAFEKENLYVALKMLNNRIKQNKELESKK